MPRRPAAKLRSDTGVLNGLDSPGKIHHDVDPCHKYLHKKFKKVATLEQVSPPNGKGIANDKPDEEEKEKAPPTSGLARYVCPYCKLACPKPSVLQKHIRAHTNERPYPCRPCGFAFKTKSNLYKHCRSRAHTLKMDADSPSEEDDDKDKGSSTEPKKIYKPKFHTLSEHDDSGESEPDKAEYPSKLALALLRPDEPPQPLNLVTKKDTTHTIDGSIIKDILLKARLKGRVDGDMEIKRRSPSPASEAQKVRLFGGEVQVLDNECRPVRVDIDPSPVLPPEVVMISKPGHHSVGRTTISAETPSPPPFGKLVVPMAPISVAGVSSVPFPAVNGITAFNPLTLPDGLVTVVHGGRAIPHVPGMPGPNTLEPLAPPPVILPLPKVPPPASEEPPLKKARVSEEFIPQLNDTSKLLKLDMPEEARTEKKFVRPTSLPLKTGGTYVSKKPACGPAAASLISPETPRPRKSYGQLYLNGHAYTYLGLKCSTRMFFCTLNKPQPIYLPLLPQHPKLSMYSNWKVCSETVLSPVGISPADAMSSYDSRNRNCHYTTASKGSSSDYMAHSSYASLQREACKEQLPSPTQKKEPIVPEETDRKNRIKVCDGGYESNEDYVYVRGRGRGRYVCEECGIRCKKPSMLKKHIRTHTDVRPYTCKYCAFSFKTKGNLTKHMKSKSHYKRCVELDISPVPTTVEESNINREMLAKQEALRAERGADITQSSEESDEEEESDDEDEDETDEDAGQSLEREAAASLLSLSEVAIKSTLDGYARLGLLSTSARPSTYPYTLTKMPEQHIPRDSALAETPITPPLVPERVASPSLPTPSDASCPIDLSNKPSGGSEPPASAAMIASIVSTTERVASSATPDPVEESRLLDRYLREKAAWQSQLRRHDSPATPTTPIPPSVPREKESEPELRQPARESALGILALTSSQAAQARIQKPIPLSPIPAKTVQPSPTSIQPVSTPPKPKAEFMPPTSNNFLNVSEDGKSVCGICQKVFTRPSQLMLHVNIHYFEHPFRCDACAVSFRTNGHLQKHQRSLSHLNKVNMNSTFGTATTTNPRPFKCDDCKIAFRIHGHLAKHLRSKMHIMRLECVGKLPFGLYAELERSGVSMNDIDTTDCENSLESLQLLAQKMHEKDPTKLGQWAPPEVTSSNSSSQMNMAICGETSSDEDEPKMGDKRLDVPREPTLLLPPPPAS